MTESRQKTAVVVAMLFGALTLMVWHIVFASYCLNNNSPESIPWYVLVYLIGTVVALVVSTFMGFLAGLCLGR